MKITPQILEKYAQGKCSETEVKLVEQWLDNPQDEEAVQNEHLFTNTQQQRVWRKLHKTIFSKKGLISISRYAAAACFVGAVFFAGRQSAMANSAKLAQEIKIQEANNLFVYGGNGAYAKIPGNEFSLQFDGQLKLYNGSREIKTVKSGDKIHTLQPMKTYILMGNKQKTTLITGLDAEMEQGGLGHLKGDFSIKVLK
ncbi:hypothetical protein ACHRV5_00850 [Flavobacterium sp. FlaQc-52]|jgi:hypothetical protein|uniref:hypothetical protein n=1 Tax=Flavobacterium sp. FlaQc-52 TaxID=3374185 RepID=UPI003756F481